MKKEKDNSQPQNYETENETLGAKFSPYQENSYGDGEEDFQGFRTRKDYIIDSLQRYWENCKVMMMSSLSHMRSPVTIIVIIFLIALYILLGWAGSVDFKYYNINVEQAITTNLDITINAILGYFFGPVTCAIGVALCTIVRMIVKLQRFYAIYFICATVAGFLHGWLLYRHKAMWFGTRFRGFYTDLLAKVSLTRFSISTFVNVLLMAILYKIMYDYPIYDYLLHYSKGGVEPLTSLYGFFSVFVVSMLFEILIVYVALVVINFIVSKAFPSQFDEPSLIVNEEGEIINPDDEDMY